MLAFALFQYVCYPWKDDRQVPAQDKHALCRADRDCKGRNQVSSPAHKMARRSLQLICS